TPGKAKEFPMQKNGRRGITVERLETRTLLSGSTVSHGLTIPPPPSPAVQADLAKVAQDKAAVAADNQAIAADKLALPAAIAAATKGASAQLATDYKAWMVVINADRAAIAAAATDAARQAAQA